MSDLTEQLDAIKARAEAATEGPWTRWQVGTSLDQMSLTTMVVSDTARLNICDTSDDSTGRADAEFIAHSREDIPRLVTAVETVLELHTKRTCEDADDCCATCLYHWPCSTVKAITAALAGES